MTRRRYSPALDSSTLALLARSSQNVKKARSRRAFVDGAMDLSVQRATSVESAQGVADAAAAAASAASGIALANGRNRVWYTATRPDNATPGSVGGSALITDDLWFSTDLVTNCIDSACKGHTVDAAGAVQVGSFPHRALYWPHRWNGSTWVDGQGQQQVIAAEIVAGAVTASKIAADAIKTTNYASTGSNANEVATAGAKMQNSASGVAVIVAENGLKVGTRWIDGRDTVAGFADIRLQAGTYSVTRQSGVFSTTAPTRDTTLCSPGWATTLYVLCPFNFGFTGTMYYPDGTVLREPVFQFSATLYDDMTEGASRSYRVFVAGIDQILSGVKRVVGVCLGFTNAAGTAVDVNTVTARVSVRLLRSSE